MATSTSTPPATRPSPNRSADASSAPTLQELADKFQAQVIANLNRAGEQAAARRAQEQAAQKAPAAPAGE